MKWEFDEEDQQYVREDGKRLSKSALEALISLLASKIAARLRRATESSLEGRSDPRAMRSKADHEIMRAHRMMAALGAGGLRQLTPEQRVTADREIVRQQTYWLRLTTQVITGASSDADAAARAEQYGAATVASFHEASKQAHVNGGYTHGTRQLTPGYDHCSECVEYAGRGRVPIDQLVPIGTDCSCGGNCQCTIDYDADAA